MDMKQYLLTITILIFLIMGCEKTDERPYQPTQFDMLEFLVPNSDLIAIIEIHDGIDKYKAKPTTKRYSVNADVKRVIIGNYHINKISILNDSYFKSQDTIATFITLYNGEHLAFLKKDNNFYKPVSGSSILDVAYNRVHPLWKQSGTETKISSGHDLEEIINEINSIAIEPISGSDGV